jgi:site-specific recombinase XerD
MHEHLDGFLVARSYAATSTQQRRSILTTFIDRVGDDPTPANVLAWWASISHLAPASRRAHLSAVRQFVTHLRAIGVLDVDPTATIAPPRVTPGPPVTMTRDETQRLLASVDDPRDRVAVALMLGCGLRGGDVARLSTTDLDLEARILRVLGKGDKVRLVPLPHLVAEMLAGFVAGLDDGPLIRTRSGERMSAQQLRARIRRALERAGVKRAPLDGRSSHVLRRTCATTLLEGGVATVADVQQVLGHASLSSTTRYLARPSAARLLGAIETGPLGDAA